MKDEKKISSNAGSIPPALYRISKEELHRIIREETNFIVKDHIEEIQYDINLLKRCLTCLSKYPEQELTMILIKSIAIRKRILQVYRKMNEANNAPDQDSSRDPGRSSGSGVGND